MNKLATLQTNRPTTQSGTVKWFAANKGFGFVVVPGIDTDFLLHQNVLVTFGRTSIAEGSFIEFEYAITESGYKITEVIAVEPPVLGDEAVDVHEVGTVLDGRVPARVKWFDPDKGYGFVNQFGSTEDIFVSINVLKRSMLGDLKSGDAICVQVAETDGRKSVYAVFDWS